MNESTTDDEAAAAADAAATPAKRGGGKVKWIILPLLLAGLAWGGNHLRMTLGTETTDDAYVTGHVHRISADTGGNLMEVLAQDNQEVRAGDLLARIDPLQYEIQEKQAAAALQQAKAGICQAEAAAAQAKSSEAQADSAIEMARAEIAQRQAALEMARITFDRNESLTRGGNRAISQADLDQARSALAVAEAALSGSQAQLASATAGKEAATAAVRVAAAQVAAAGADVSAGEATAREARRQLDLTEIKAPAGGRIGNRSAETGNRVQTGQAMFALVEDDCWVVANFKETQLGRMHPGQPVDIEIDALGGKKFSGKVESIAPASGAQFALLPPDNATGNFTKVVQRVPVKIILDNSSAKEARGVLRPGLSTVVRVRP